MFKHPGGAIWFIRSSGRDISMAVHAYHTDADRQMKILEKYEVPDKKPEDVFDHHMHLPPHLVPPGFDATTDSISFDFSKKDNFLLRV